jgi:hypothetical protein
MANPNIVGVASIYANTSLNNLTTTTTNVLTNSTSSGTVHKLNNIILSNYSANTTFANVVIDRSATKYFLGGNVSIPANSALVLLAKDMSIYMLEGDVLQANVSANASITLTASYETIS